MPRLRFISKHSKPDVLMKRKMGLRHDSIQMKGPPFEEFKSDFDIMKHLHDVPDGLLNRKRREYLDDVTSMVQHINNVIDDCNNIVNISQYLKTLKELYERIGEEPSPFFLYYLGENYRPSNVRKTQLTGRLGGQATSWKGPQFPPHHLQRLDSEISRLQSLVHEQVALEMQKFQDACNLRLVMLTDVSDWLHGQHLILDDYLQTLYEACNFYEQEDEQKLYKQLQKFMEYLEKAVHQTRDLSLQLFSVGSEDTYRCDKKSTSSMAMVKLTLAQVPSAGTMFRNKSKFYWSVKKVSNILQFCNSLTDNQKSKRTMECSMELFANMMTVVEQNFEKIESNDYRMAALHKRLAETCSGLDHGEVRLIEVQKQHQTLMVKHHDLTQKLSTVKLENQLLEKKLDHLDTTVSAMHLAKQKAPSATTLSASLSPLRLNQHQAPSSTSPLDMRQQKSSTTVSISGEKQKPPSIPIPQIREEKPRASDITPWLQSTVPLSADKPPVLKETRAPCTESLIDVQTEIGKTLSKLKESQTSESSSVNKPAASRSIQKEEDVMTDLKKEIEFYKRAMCVLKNKIDKLKQYATLLENEIGQIPGNIRSHFREMDEPTRRAMEKAEKVRQATQLQEQDLPPDQLAQFPSLSPESPIHQLKMIDFSSRSLAQAKQLEVHSEQSVQKIQKNMGSEISQNMTNQPPVSEMPRTDSVTLVRSSSRLRTESVQKECISPEGSDLSKPRASQDKLNISATMPQSTKSSSQSPEREADLTPETTQSQPWAASKEVELIPRSLKMKPTPSLPNREKNQLPAESRQLPAESRQLPAESRQLPAESRQLPAESRQLPAESCQLPAKSHQLPEESRQLPAESRQLPAESRQLPAESHQLTAESHQLSAESQGTEETSKQPDEPTVTTQSIVTAPQVKAKPISIPQYEEPGIREESEASSRSKTYGKAGKKQRTKEYQSSITLKKAAEKWKKYSRKGLKYEKDKKSECKTGDILKTVGEQIKICKTSESEIDTTKSEREKMSKYETRSTSKTVREAMETSKKLYYKTDKTDDTLKSGAQAENLITLKKTVKSLSKVEPEEDIRDTRPDFDTDDILAVRKKKLDTIGMASEPTTGETIRPTSMKYSSERSEVATIKSLKRTAETKGKNFSERETVLPLESVTIDSSAKISRETEKPSLKESGWKTPTDSETNDFWKTTLQKKKRDTQEVSSKPKTKESLETAAVPKSRRKTVQKYSTALKLAKASSVSPTDLRKESLDERKPERGRKHSRKTGLSVHIMASRKHVYHSQKTEKKDLGDEQDIRGQRPISGHSVAQTPPSSACKESTEGKRPTTVPFINDTDNTDYLAEPYLLPLEEQCMRMICVNIMRQFLSLGLKLSVIFDAHDLNDMSERVMQAHSSLATTVNNDHYDVLRGLAEAVEMYFEQIQVVIKRALSTIDPKKMEARIIKKRQEKTQELIQKSSVLQIKQNCLEEQYRSLWFMHLSLCEAVLNKRQNRSYAYVSKAEYFNQTPMTAAENGLKLPKGLVENNVAVLNEAFQKKKISSKCFEMGRACLEELDTIYRSQLPFLVHLFMIGQWIAETGQLTKEQCRLHPRGTERYLKWKNWYDKRTARLQCRFQRVMVQLRQWRDEKPRAIFRAWFLFNQIFLETGVRLACPQPSCNSVPEGSRSLFTQMSRDLSKRRTVLNITPDNFQQLLSGSRQVPTHTRKPKLVFGSDQTLHVDTRQSVASATGPQGFAPAPDSADITQVDSRVGYSTMHSPKRVPIVKTDTIIQEDAEDLEMLKGQS